MSQSQCGHQLANQTQAHLQAEAFSEASFREISMRSSLIHSVLAPLSKCCPHLEGRLLTRYSPVRHLVFTEINTPFDLHVLSTPPAFVLSQDQTLQKNYFSKNRLALNYLFKSKNRLALNYLFKEIYLGHLLKADTAHSSVRKHCALFSFQRTSDLSKSACLFYLTQKILSSTFFNFF